MGFLGVADKSQSRMGLRIHGIALQPVQTRRVNLGMNEAWANKARMTS